MDFRRGKITPESVWRALILYGSNSATYKFAFGQTLLDVAASGERTHVSLQDLAPRYADLLCEALNREPRQGTSERSQFLDVCRSYNAGETERSPLLEATERLGFVNVVQAFPRLGPTSVPISFYEDRRKDPHVRGLVLTDELLDLATSLESANLDLETTARWRLVETAWSTRISGGLLAPVVRYNALSESLTIGEARRRRSVAGVREAINGYQDGKCAYCCQPMVLRARGEVIVEHVLPFQLLRHGWTGPDNDAVWNLVLSCKPCNDQKRGHAPHETWMPWLETRNNDFIASNHPLRETLIAQTGATAAARRAFLRTAYRAATEAIPGPWIPPAI